MKKTSDKAFSSMLQTLRGVDSIFTQLAIKADGKCEYCDFDGLLHYRILNSFVRDHLIPKRSRGGDELANLVFACPCCNGDKGHFNPALGAPPNASRRTLIKRARNYIAQKRSKYREDLWTALRRLRLSDV